MAFVDYEYFKNLYGADAIDEQTFNRFLWKAEHIICDATTGIDGVCKLKCAFPENEEDVEAVQRCVCELIELSAKIEILNSNLTDGKVVKSMSAGNESISYETGGLVGGVVSSKKAQSKLFLETIETYLRNTKDKNGVNLLYLGVYPCSIY